MTGIEPQQVLIAKLARLWPGGCIGRTALMKACYLLEVVRGVPLPYRFTLYSYGPFDKSVLYDLAVAGNLGLVEEQCVVNSMSYGYEIRSNADDNRLDELGEGFLAEHADSIAWVVGEFGGYSASQLELAATIIYADRESMDEDRGETAATLAAAVLALKPRFPSEVIAGEIQMLREKGLLHLNG